MVAPRATPLRRPLRAGTLLPAIALVHTAVWATALRSFPFPYSPRTALAQYLSSLALVVLSANLLLATRARWLEGAFEGLDKMFATHRADGVAAALAIIAHAVIVPITMPILPGRAIGLTVFLLLESSAALAIAPRAPWRRLLRVRYQTWKAEHRFMGVFVAAATLHSLLVPTLVRAMPLLTGWVYGTVAIGLGAYVYRETWFRVWARRHSYRVAKSVHLESDVLEVDLEPARSPISYRAGEFAFVSFRGGPTRERHPFTISAAPDQGRLRFSVKASGDYTDALLAGLAEGSSADVEGPHGRFDFTRGRPRQLWLAGGIGITPFLAFLPTVDADREILLVWTVHSRVEAGYLAEVEAVAELHHNVRYTLWPSDELGHVSLAELGIERPDELSVYLCGPIAMRDALLEQLAALGVARREVHYEEFTLR